MSVIDVKATPTPGVSVAAGDFADITTTTVTEVAWGASGELVVRFEGDLTPEQQAKVRRRIQSVSRTEEDLRAACEAWMGGPIVKELFAVNMQVRRLTRLVLAAEMSPDPTPPTIL